MKAKKSLGQHFLTSNRALESIVEAGDLKENSLVLEIGPGKGVLTEKLLEKSRVLAVEKDSDMIPILNERFEKELTNKRLQILQMDILDFDPKKYIFEKYKLVANIPYYITGEIIKKFLETNLSPETIVLLIQKEVCDRIIARDGKESILSLSVKFFGKPVFIETVKAGSFTPKPKVDSAIIKIEVTNKRSEKEISDFFQLIKAGFAHKRKMLLSNLAPIYSKDQITLAFENLNIPLNHRAEDLNLETWIKMSSILKPQL